MKSIGMLMVVASAPTGARTELTRRHRKFPLHFRIAQKDKELGWLREENARLKENIALLRKDATAEPGT